VPREAATGRYEPIRRQRIGVRFHVVFSLHARCDGIPVSNSLTSDSSNVPVFSLASVLSLFQRVWSIEWHKHKLNGAATKIKSRLTF
jgi:hypothetical protein